MISQIYIIKQAHEIGKQYHFWIEKSITLSIPLVPCNQEFRCFQSYLLDSELPLEQHQSLQFSEFCKHRSTCSRSWHHDARFSWNGGNSICRNGHEKRSKILVFIDQSTWKWSFTKSSDVSITFFLPSSKVQSKLNHNPKCQFLPAVLNQELLQCPSRDVLNHDTTRSRWKWIERSG